MLTAAHVVEGAVSVTRSGKVRFPAKIIREAALDRGLWAMLTVPGRT